jgi:hypothetical protein
MCHSEERVQLTTQYTLVIENKTSNMNLYNIVI